MKSSVKISLIKFLYYIYINLFLESPNNFQFLIFQILILFATENLQSEILFLVLSIQYFSIA